MRKKRKVSRPSLVITNTFFAGTVVALKGGRLSIGRALKNNVVLDDSDVSGFHAEIRKAGLRYRIVDLNSQGGISVNGRKVSSHTLRNGDKIKIGRFEFRFNC